MPFPRKKNYHTNFKMLKRLKGGQVLFRIVHKLMIL